MADESPAGGPLPLIVALIALYFMWVYAIDPALKWAKENFMFLVFFLAGGLVVAVGAVLIFVVPKILEAREKQKAEAYLYGQVATPPVEEPETKSPFSKPEKKKKSQKLLDKLFGKETVDGKGPLKTARKATQQKPAVNLNAVAGAIMKFKPSREYTDEFGYRSELSDYLANTFPNSDVVLRTDPLLPDIGIEDVAIDVRASAVDDAIDALISKCPKYRNVYSDLVILFLKPNFSEKANDKLLSSLKKDYPEARVITKR